MNTSYRPLIQFYHVTYPAPIINPFFLEKGKPYSAVGFYHYRNMLHTLLELELIQKITFKKAYSSARRVFLFSL
jgi:hypothetical protein